MVDPSNLFGNEFEDVDSGVETTATATASTAASSCTMSSHGGKDQAHQQGWGRKRKKCICGSLESHHLLMQVMKVKRGTLSGI